MATPYRCSGYALKHTLYKVISERSTEGSQNQDGRSQLNDFSDAVRKS
ncbi:hypothetical protein ACQ4M4_03695 [Leptolyngbya sp. AN02str]